MSEVTATVNGGTSSPIAVKEECTKVNSPHSEGFPALNDNVTASNNHPSTSIDNASSIEEASIAIGDTSIAIEDAPVNEDEAPSAFDSASSTIDNAPSAIDDAPPKAEKNPSATGDATVIDENATLGIECAPNSNEDTLTVVDDEQSVTTFILDGTTLVLEEDLPPEESLIDMPAQIKEDGVTPEPEDELPDPCTNVQIIDLVPSTDQPDDVITTELTQLQPVAIDLPVPSDPQTTTLTSLESPKPSVELLQLPRCLSRTPRKSAYSSSILTPAEITKEIIARAEKKRHMFPDPMDLLIAMNSKSKNSIAKIEHAIAKPLPPKLPKLRDEDKKLDAKELLMILQDGEMGTELNNKRKTPKSPKKVRPKLDLKIDPELERELALKQLEEFSSRKTERKSRSSNNNVEKKEKEIKNEKDVRKEPIKKVAKKDPVKKETVKNLKKPTKAIAKSNPKLLKNAKGAKKVVVVKKPVEEKLMKKEIKKEKLVVDKPDESQDRRDEEKGPKKRPSTANGPPPKRGPNRELHRLLQDEGAINMLYDVEKGESAESKDRLSSKRRLKKVLKKKALEVEAAILTATSSRGSHRSLRTSEKRKFSVESVESTTTGPESTTEPESSEPPLPSGEKEPVTTPSHRSLPQSSRIIRRHSSSSSYSSRGNSPLRMSEERECSPPTCSMEIKLEPGMSSNSPTLSYNDDFLYQGQDKSIISERAEKLIEMKVRELNLQPHHGAIIKQLIVEKKNGLKERLQSEFAVKFKAALSPKTSSPESSVAEATPKPSGVVLNAAALKQLKAKAQSLMNVQTPVVTSDTTSPPVAMVPDEGASSSKPAWKTLVEEDWGDSGDELDPDDPPPTKSVEAEKIEKRRQSKSMEADICSFAEKLAAQINASTALIKAPLESVRSLSKSAASTLSRASLKVEVDDSGDEDPTSTAEELNIPSSVSGPSPGSDVRLERMNAIIRLYIKPTYCRLPNSLSCKVLNELTQAFDYLESSSDTRVIVLVWPPLHEAMTAITESEHEGDFREQLSEATAGRNSPVHRQQVVEVLPTDIVNHSNGIDLLALCADSGEERRKAATETANAIKDLTHKLATCSRLVCTAVSGKAIGLSVVLLAYCDFVLADETATFSTPYAQLGYLPEAAAAHTLPLVIGKKKTNWLLLGNGTLSASEAEVCGLVTRVVPRQSALAHELCLLARNISATSLLATESAKGMINHSIKSTIQNTLRTEAKILETHWSAPDTQHRMKNFAVQLILDMHKDQSKKRPSRTSGPGDSISRTEVVSAATEEFEVPATNLVFEEPSDHLDIDPLQSVDDLHFEDPTTLTLELPSAHIDHSYELKQLR